MAATLVFASMLTVAYAPEPAAAATNTTTSALGCGTNLHVGTLDAPLLVAALMIQNGSFTLSGDQFNCILHAKEIVPGFGFVLAGGAQNMRVTLTRVGGCLIVCLPLPGPRDIKVSFSGSAGGCLPIMLGVRTTAAPNTVSFQCPAMSTKVGATIYTGLNSSGGLATLLGCPKLSGSGSLNWPTFSMQSWRVVSGSPGSVNGNAPLAILGGDIVGDFVGKFVNPLIMDLMSKCAGASVGILSQDVQVGVTTR
ncbi:MAG: hypothetical protein IT198_07440 [Acidimicrobiia bacterium]|nr:hypothetical protein [Acidimicrobiia bacterium]